MDKLTYAYISRVHFIQVSLNRWYLSHVKLYIYIYEWLWWHGRSGVLEMPSGSDILHFRFVKPALLCKEKTKKELRSHTVYCY